MRVHLYRGKPLRKEDYILNENMQYSVGYFKDGFVYGSLTVIHDKYFICVGVAGVFLNSLVNNATATLIEVIPETVGEYTNLTDKNDKKIFEGDIIKQINSYDKLEMTGFVRFSKSSQFVISHTYTEKENCYKRGMKKAFAIKTNCEIIGNIYDNHELLEV
mgnify:FL=1